MINITKHNIILLGIKHNTYDYSLLGIHTQVHDLPV